MSLLNPRRVLYTALGLHLFLVLVRSINDPDIWWHLRTGQHILHTFSIPRADIYSFTNFGKQWIPHEWLSEVLMYAAYRSLGWIGLIALSSILTAAVFFYVGRHCKAPPQIVVLCVVVAQAASLVVLTDPRPRLATLAFSAYFFITLRDYIANNEPKMLWPLPVVMVLWVNLHAGYPLGFVLILLGVVVLTLQGNYKSLRHLAVILILCLAAVLINPHGARMFSYPFETQFSAVQMSVISEWNAPDFREPDTLPFLILILSMLGALGLSRKRISNYDLFALLFACFIALRSRRHVSVLSLIAIPILAEHLWHWVSSTQYGQRLLNRPDSNEKLLPILLVVMVIVLHFPTVYRTIKNPVNLAEKPVAATTFLQQQSLPDNVFSKYEWNDYLIWNAPSRKVYIDGRADMYGDEFLQKFIGLYMEGTNWESELDRFGVRTIVVEPSSRLAQLVKQNPIWMEVYRDPQAVIFVKK
jgi:hypothetical protein